MNYFSLVHAAQTATPPPDLGADAGGDDGTPAVAAAPAAAPQGLASLPGVAEREAEKAAGGKAVEEWRRRLLREMLRSELGFNTVVKDSGLPGGGAGLGLFVEGSAPEGAIVGIYPVGRTAFFCAVVGSGGRFGVSLDDTD